MRVLIVDDDPAIRTITALALRRAGWQVEDAGSGAAALEKYDREVDVVLLDLMMPDMDGRELLAALQRVNPDVKAVFITAMHDLDEELASLGAQGVLRKPYDPLVLGDQLAAMLRS